MRAALKSLGTRVQAGLEVTCKVVLLFQLFFPLKTLKYNTYQAGQNADYSLVKGLLCPLAELRTRAGQCSEVWPWIPPPQGPPLTFMGTCSLLVRHARALGAHVCHPQHHTGATS